MIITIIDTVIPIINMVINIIDMIITIIDMVINITRPKPAYGRQGLAGVVDMVIKIIDMIISIIDMVINIIISQYECMASNGVEEPGEEATAIVGLQVLCE